MKIKLNVADPEKFIRRCGYGRLENRNTGQVSYVRRLTRLLYPRFHVYIEKQGDFYMLNLHLDQKQPIYKGVTAHSGEYDGKVVEEEGQRILSSQVV